MHSNYEFCRTAAMEHLIESVRKHPCLWNSEVPVYKNNELKERAWCEVVKECALFDGREARSLWKNLRDGHRQAIARKKTAGSMTKWRYEDQMEFLLPTMALRSLKRPRLRSPESRRRAYLREDTSSIQSEDSFGGEPQNEDTDNERAYASEFVAIEYEQEKVEIKTERESPEQETFPKPIIASTSSFSDVNHQHIEPTSTFATTTVAAHQNKALEKFFMSMFETTNNLPEILQHRVQRQVFQIVMDAQEEHLTAKTARLSTP
ncbi:uncharacterized protein LOC126368484 [Pectinophora gossypiella]|uniref:uncharacterized protein LOC126368484 n=1 Tax=Pectinophora gossypiella TaxID=13191 RepID=UPI00214EA9FA|nr:uncharacterized protein LOC126368484 [Pectinophora gossypiella]